MKPHLEGQHLALDGAGGEGLKAHVGLPSMMEGGVGLLGKEQVVGADAAGTILIVERLAELIFDNHARLQGVALVALHDNASQAFNLKESLKKACI